MSGLNTHHDRKGLAIFMFLSNRPQERGQRSRDFLRLQALERVDEGCMMFSCDQHVEQDGMEGRHIEANINETRFQKSMKIRWPEYQFDFVVLDWFGIFSSYCDNGVFSKDGRFFKDNIPFLAKDFGVKVFWLPNNKTILEKVQEADLILQGCGLRWELVRSRFANPLYRATCKVNDRIKKLPQESKENDNQTQNNLDSDYPFIRIYQAGY